MVTFAGQVIVGGVTSFKVTVNVQLAEFPLPSLAVSVTFSKSLWPFNAVVGAGNCVTVGFALQLSLKVAGVYAPTTPAQLAFAAIVTFAGQVMVGGVTSFKVTVKVQEVVFPFPSFAVNVTISKSLWPFNAVVGAGNCVTVGLGLQLSATVTGVYAPTTPAQLAFAAMVTFAGQVIVGGVTSFNVTVKVQLAEFPFPSLAVSVTFSKSLWPFNAVVGAGDCATVGFALQLSLKVAGVYAPTTPAQLAFAAIVTFAGQVMVGGVTSFNVTVKVQLAEFPFPSFAVSVTVSTSLWPFKAVVDAGNCVTVGFGLQLSLKFAGVYAPTTPAQLALAAMVTFAGQVIVGGVTSITEAVTVPMPMQPLSFTVTV